MAVPLFKPASCVGILMPLGAMSWDCQAVRGEKKEKKRRVEIGQVVILLRGVTRRGKVIM
jgi:hypothetical protein